MMRFTVASWHRHHDDPDWWIVHNGYTTMTSPPQWAREAGRNITLFAPPPHIVFGGYSPDEYTPIYWDTLRGRWGAIKQWVAEHDNQHVMLLCACQEGKFCHRLLLAKLLRQMGCEEVVLPGEEMPEGAMKALTVTNPWGLLIAIGAKKIETRSWLTSYRGPVAIHTSKKMTNEDKQTCLTMPFVEDIYNAGYHTLSDMMATCGMVVATATLADCTYMDWDWIATVDKRERSYGFYAEDRYAWHLTDVQHIDPIPAKGMQGLWNWTPPMEIPANTR